VGASTSALAYQFSSHYGGGVAESTTIPK